MNNFTEETILLNDRSERQRTKSMENERYILERTKYCFVRMKKNRTNWVVHER